MYLNCPCENGKVPRVAQIGPYRFFFYSNEENEPPHIHVKNERRLAKFWLEPVELASSKRFAAHELREIESIVTENRQMFRDAWNDHFDR